MMPIAAAAGLLADLSVSAETIAGIKEILSRNIEDLEAKPLDRTSQSAFGQSYWGGQLGHHTSIAERHVVDAINDLVVGLDGYRASVEWAWQHIDETDGGVTGSLTGITVRIDENKFDSAAACVDQPNLETNPSCEVPTGEN
jgi:hypothetical protein